MDLSFGNVSFRYDPYPIGLATGVLPDRTYADMIARWPPRDLFMFIASQGNKYALSELYHTRQYREFVRAHEVWRQFHELVKSRGFIAHVVGMLVDHHSDLGLRVDAREPGSSGLAAAWRHRARAALARVRQRLAGAHLGARFEFSTMPADGGFIVPHPPGTPCIPCAGRAAPRCGKR